MADEPRLRIITAVYALVLIFVIGIVGLMFLEGWSVIDAAWVTVISLTTTGFGDIVPASTGGRIFLMFLLVVGVGVVAYAAGALISFLVEVQISRYMDNSGMKEAISSLRNHIVICGAGRVGGNVVDILKAENVPFVLIDENEELIASLRDEGLLAMTGDATKDEVLLEAGILHARGVISALSDDAYNVFVTLTARHLNPNLMVVARAERPETIDKLKRAGADKVIAPAQLGGQRMASAILKPVSVDLVDTLFTNRNLQIQLEELSVSADSNMCGKHLQDIFTREDSNIIVVAIIRSESEDVILNPRAKELIHANDTLVLLGSRNHLEQLEKRTSN